MVDLIFQIFITTAFITGLFMAYKCGKSNNCPLHN
jgi:hypothetical protein